MKKNIKTSKNEAIPSSRPQAIEIENRLLVSKKPNSGASTSHKNTSLIARTASLVSAPLAPKHVEIRPSEPSPSKNTQAGSRYLNSFNRQTEIEITRIEPQANPSANNNKRKFTDDEFEKLRIENKRLKLENNECLKTTKYFFSSISVWACSTSIVQLYNSTCIIVITYL